MRRFRTNQTGRSLVDITGDSEVFVHLHKYFVFLLKAGGQRVIECVLEGPPRVMAVSSHQNLSQSQDGGGDEHARLEHSLNILDFQVVRGECSHGYRLLVLMSWYSSFTVEGQPVFQSLKHLFSVSLHNLPCLV